MENLWQIIQFSRVCSILFMYQFSSISLKNLIYDKQDVLFQIIDISIIDIQAALVISNFRGLRLSLRVISRTS